MAGRQRKKQVAGGTKKGAPKRLLAKKHSDRKKTVLRASALISPGTVEGLTDPTSLRRLRTSMKQRTPAEARELLIASGIYTAAGRLSEHYQEDD
jgi:hypothetical protein